MKKHELLKYAYDNYPAGTVARFKCKNSANHTSCGSFVLTFDNDNGLCVCSEKDESNTFYISIDSHTGNHIEEWAKVVTKPEEEKVLYVSEDGVDMYPYSEVHTVRFYEDNWHFGNSYDKVKEGSSFNVNPAFNGDDRKAFSTKEAAEKWILEQNKPKYKSVQLYHGMEARIYHHNSEVAIMDGGHHIHTMTFGDIHDIRSIINQD